MPHGMPSPHRRRSARNRHNDTEPKEHNMSWDRSPLDAVNVIRKQSNGQVVLVLQGGGALGAYQGGVYEALHEAKIEPDWIIGTSIGAINASIIAGNAIEHRLDRLREFWRRMERNAFWSALPAWTGIADSLSAWATVTTGIPGFFETNARAFLGAHVPLGTDAAGYYSTAPLRKTLNDLVDFDLINRNKPRLMVGAAHVRTSMMRYFDSRDTEIKVEHIMASGALPPAFPAVRIDGELYWDGGILSTPSRRTISRYPSCLISCTQSGPAGGLAARVGMQSSTKPLGGGVSMASLYRLVASAGNCHSVAELSLRGQTGENA
jgi:predicted acylesterase/phospholipase RssA